LKVTQISHAFGLLQLPPQSKRLSFWCIGETGSRVAHPLMLRAICMGGAAEQKGRTVPADVHNHGQPFGFFLREPENLAPEPWFASVNKLPPIFILPAGFLSCLSLWTSAVCTLLALLTAYRTSSTRQDTPSLAEI
jgi:hypothetical protein